MPTDVIIDPSTGQIYWNDSTGSPQSISIKGDAQNAISFVGYSASFSPGSSVGGTTTLVTVNDNSGTDALVPGTSGFNLGSAVLRWNTFATNANLSGTLVVSDSTLSSSILSGSARFNGGIAISGNASIGQSFLLYGAGTAYTSYTGFKAGSVTSNTLYTLPLTYPGSGSSILQSDTSGNLTWVAMSASSSGGTVSSGTQYQIAGYYAGTGASVAGSNTFTNNTASGQVQILHTTASTSTSTGALQVAGGVGISGRLTYNLAAFGTTGISSNPTMAMIGQTGDPIFLSILEDNSITFEGSQGQLFSISPNLTTGFIWAVNDISGVPLLRASAGGTVYISEFGGVLGIGQTNPTYKLDLKGSFGLASSNDALYNFIFSNSAVSGSNSFQVRSANSILLYNSGNTFYTGLKSNAASNVTYTLPTTDGSPDQFLKTNGSGTLSWGTPSGGSGGGGTGVGAGGQYEVAVYPATGSSVVGYSSLKNDVSANVVSISHSTASTTFSNGALTVSGGVGIGGSLYVGGTGSSISGVRIASGAITAGAWNGTIIGVQYGGTGANLTGLSGVLVVSSGTVSASTTPNIYSATGTSLYLSASSPSTSTTTGALTVPGGVGIGGSVSVGGRLQIFNGSNYAAFLFAGTSNTAYTLPSSSPATGTSILQSDPSGIMSWVPMSASGSTANSISIGFASTNSFHPVLFTPSQSVSGSAISSNTSLVYNPSTDIFYSSGILVTSQTASTTRGTGALVVYGGLGVSGQVNSDSLVTAGNAVINGNFEFKGIGTFGNNAAADTIAFNARSSTDFNPSANDSYDLGSSSLIWRNGYINNINGFGVTSTFARFTGTENSTSTTTGALRIVGGVGIGQSVSIGGRLQLFNSSNYTAFVSSASGNTTYTLPASSPATGTSVLQSDSTGLMTWVPMVATGGAGSGTVAIPDGQYRLAYYAGTGASVSSTNLITAVGTGVTILGATNASSTTVAALSVLGGLGVTGNAFIGGTTTITNTTVGSGVSSAALVVAGSLGVNGNVWIAQEPNSKLSIMQSSGDEGGEIFLNKPVTNTSITTGVTIDIFQNRLRFFEQGGSARGFYLDITTGGNGVGTNIMGGSSSGTVNSGTATFAAYYAASTNAVNENANLQFTGSGISIGGNIPATSTTSGSLRVYGGVGIGGTLYVNGNVRVGTDTFTKNYSQGDILLDNGTTDTPAIRYYWANNKNFGTDVISSGAGSTKYRVVKDINETGGTELFSIDTTGAIQIYNGANYSGFRYSGTANTIYTLPPNSPQSASGTSVLTSTIAGVMSWVGMTAGGSATPGGSNKQIQYNNSTAFAGASGFEYTAGGTAITVSMFSPSGTGYTAGLWVHSIDGAVTRVGIGLSNPAYELEINGEISATNKSFVIDHPTKEGMKLRYGSLEGPENGVYARGELKNSNVIILPEHWVGLVHQDSYSVHLTPIGKGSSLYVEKIENYNVYIADDNNNPIHCYYSVWAERKDIPKLITEYEAQ